MSIAVPRVFISSTSEFAAERELLKQKIESLPDLRLDAYTYEAEAAGTAPPETRLRGVLESSEIFLLILGDTFGSEYPGRPTSIVEWEYEYAKAKKKELKGYVKHPLGANADPRQSAFVSRAVAFRSGSWIRRFGDASQMIAAVITDLRKWVTDAGTLLLTTRGERNQWKDRVSLLTCVFIALLTVGGIVAGALLGVTVGTLAVVLACGVSMFGAMFLILKSNVF